MTIPQELKNRKQWCCWINSNGSKLPITPSGGVFRSNDPSTFSTYDEAESSGKPIAYVIQPSDGLTGIDLDNCLDESGNLRSWAVPIVTRLDGIAYGEISPSGKGIKFLTIGKKPNGAKCQHKFASDKQQIEVYDFNRFWTITKDLYAGNRNIGDGSTVVDWICKTYLSEQSGNLADVSIPELQSRVELPLQERAKQYIDGMPLPGEGGRNSAAFSLAGHLLAMVDSGGRSLSVEQAQELVLIWNAKLGEPLSAKEIEKAVRSASKNGTKRDPKHPPVSALPIEHTPAIPKQTIPQSLLRPAGTISEIIDYTLATSMYPQPELALAGAIALMATITGRRITDDYGTRTNVYIIGLAPSGSGKEQARKTNKKLLEYAGAESMIGPERIGSSAGLVTHISASPAILFQLDEMGRMLSTLKNPAKAPHLYNITTVLMQIYGCSDTIWIGDAYADAKKTQKINQPHPVIYGTAVPSGFWESLTADNVTDGLIGRMLPFESSTGYVEPQTPAMIEPPASLVESIAYWIGLGLSKPAANLGDRFPGPVVFRYTRDAKRRFDEHMMDIAKRRRSEDDQAAALWSRAAGKAGKLALVFAASRQAFVESPVVDFNDIDAAIKISNSITRTIQRQVFEHVSANDQEDRVKKVYRLLMTPMTKSEITRKTQWLGRRERTEILETLLESGLIEFDEIQVKGGGPAKTVFKKSELKNA